MLHGIYVCFVKKIYAGDVSNTALSEDVSILEENLQVANEKIESLQIELMAFKCDENIAAKGQLISKCLFGVFNSPKKRTKKIRFEVQ